MRSQVLREQSIGAQAFGALLRAHMSATRQLNAQLVADHGLTLSDYGVLLQLAWAPDRRLRRVDLADRILLTASGITRLLDGLEHCGFVERAACDTDRRVVYAVLTDEGLEKLRVAAKTHLEQIDSLFGARLSEDELESLVTLLGKLDEDAGGEDDCEPPEEPA
jgi:DNA-binding MarR family transcriptional regulator